MKSKFTTIDIIAIVAELNERLAGMRVVQVYDVDHKTYLLKLQRPEQKAVLLLESGARIHATEYEWPKNPAPSGFSMKLRKHIRNKRLESVRQLGVDRVVDLQFGSDEVAHHVILELYDRGNLVLTDHQYTILNILRPRTDAESVRFASKENYPVDKVRMYEARAEDQLRGIVTGAKEGDVLKKVINPHLDFGPALIEHLLLEAGFPPLARVGHEFRAEDDMHRLMAAVRAGEAVLRNERQDFKGIVTYRVEKRAAGGRGSGGGGADAEVLSYQEFHPMLYAQHAEQPHHTFLSFTAAVDEYFSKLESQKLDMKAVQQERDALKKLDNVRRDHQRRLEALELAQRDDKWRAELITGNASLVDGAALVVRSALANQIDWREIGRIVQEAQKRGDPVARAIKALKLETNHITMLLHDPYQEESDEDDAEDGEDDPPPPPSESSHIRPMLVDIDLDLSALANATRYFGQKRTAARKQQKTIESSFKAMKSAEQKTKQTLKEAATIASINKARRVHWFEKFLWFISSENYLVLGGRDQQQNEILVRRYLRPGDIYVHGDLHGAASLVIKNPAGGDVPPKTLNEAGSFAVCNSSAWDAKIVTSAWWVHAHQVSKTAPTGEYLTTGSFMVRGKKNYLPPCQLVLGFGVLFKLEESSLERHRGERRVRTLESEDSVSSFATGEDAQEEEEEEGEKPAAGEDTADSEDSEADGAARGDEERGSPVEDAEGKVEATAEEKEDVKEDAEEEKKDEEEAGAEGEDAFPDTNVEVKHVKGSHFTVEVTSPTDGRAPHHPFPALPGPKPTARRGGGKKSGGPSSAGKEKKQNCAPAPQQPRGKRSKMKRAKEKYKDQDDEEREARMAILQSAGRSHAAVAEEKRQQEQQEKQQRQQQQQQKRREQLKARQEAAADEIDDEEAAVPQDCQILDEFTGIPVEEDELLYAIPVCAPWSTVLSYKFKVKLTPSAGKKGKATKTAVQSFLSDKAATPRERDLVKSVRLEDVTRNFPGRVKIVLPQAARAKKK